MVASATQYDEQKVRDIFTSFGEVFWENKKIIEEKLIVSMKDLTPQKRTGLIKTFSSQSVLLIGLFNKLF